MPSSASRIIFAIVDLPAPLGLERTKRSPRRLRGLTVAMAATGAAHRRPSSRHRLAKLCRDVGQLPVEDAAIPVRSHSDPARKRVCHLARLGIRAEEKRAELPHLLLVAEPPGNADLLHDDFAYAQMPAPEVEGIVRVEEHTLMAGAVARTYEVVEESSYAAGGVDVAHDNVAAGGDVGGKAVEETALVHDVVNARQADGDRVVTRPQLRL